MFSALTTVLSSLIEASVSDRSFRKLEMDLSRVCRFKSKDTSYIFHQESFKGTVIEPSVSGKSEKQMRHTFT